MDIATIIMSCSLVVLGDSAGSVEPFRNLVDQIISTEDPNSSVVVLGDIFDENLNNDIAQLTQISRLEEFFSNSIVVRGNHDPTDIFFENFEELPYTKDICENVSIIAIDSNRHRMRQLTFIKDEIERRPERNYVVALHHHLEACSTGDISPTFWKVALENTLRPQDLVVHGHSHTNNNYFLSNGTLVLTSASANRKRYDCLENTECNCDDSPSLNYLKIEFEDSQWKWDREFFNPELTPWVHRML